MLRMLRHLRDVVDDETFSEFPQRFIESAILLSANSMIYKLHGPHARGIDIGPASTFR